jgi:Cft2 family RNA processing exonuclease
MNLHFLGGAHEVGASSTLIEIEGHRILVDAGIRMGSEQDSQLPNLDAVGGVDAVLLTHAHTDHTGALPVLMRDLPPDVKVYCIPPTKLITKVLLEDSAKRMQREEQEENKPPLYTPEDVTLVLQRMETVRWDKPVSICDGVRATWLRAGHILGAGMIYIEGKQESLLMTGDVSVTDQLTIPGMDEQLPYQPDVMVMESTYGNRQHKDRTEQVNKFVQAVAKTVAAGGKVLIPAFAVGRSQEVILILKDAMERKQFPVYVDGMVKKVNDIYSGLPNELSPPLPHIAECGEDIFYSDTIMPVPTHYDRDRVSSWEPCCIVASSGMLIGGMSERYAKQLVGNPKNLIAITGYQAEGTPGRALLDLEDQNDSTDREWTLNDGPKLLVKCQVKRFSLSAHADSAQLTELVKKVQPRNLFLVHGDKDARKKLSQSVRKTSPDVEVKLPKNGRKYTVTKQAGIAGGRQLWSDRILSELYTFLVKKGAKRPFRVRELAEMWFGTEETTPIAVKFFHWCLSLDRRFFVRDSKDSNSFRLKPIV